MDAPEQKKIFSQLEMNNLDEYIMMAKLSDKKYEAQPEQVVLQNMDFVAERYENSKFNAVFIENIMKNSNVKLKEEKPLRIPRRPKFHVGQSGPEFQLSEKESFLNWRRAIAMMEEQYPTLSITPFEKSIEIWRQLWLVVEKADVLVQIVDCRNPLFFRCEDLETYVKEAGEDKELILLLNKADLLSKEMREHWAEYFKENGISFVYFSATIEQKKNEEGKEEEPTNINLSTTDILNRGELIEVIKSKCKKEKVSVGFVGFPNVGKSSIINVLMTCKKVGVAAMPGKTKHYQSLRLPEDDNFTLLDCPGLVFPSFKDSKEVMICNGIIPIDNLSIYLPAISLIVQCVPSINLENLYGIKLPDIFSASLFLSKIAEKRKCITGSGNPDLARTAKAVLKDLVNGKLLMCAVRPDYNVEKHGEVRNFSVIDNADYSIFEENKDMLKQVPETFMEDMQKIFIDEDKFVEKFNEDDEEFFAQRHKPKDVKIDKGMRRELKFAIKRGVITEEEFESCETMTQAKALLKRVNEGNDDTLKSKKAIY